jgi:hypothetical protein
MIFHNPQKDMPLEAGFQITGENIGHRKIYRLRVIHFCRVAAISLLLNVFPYA